jgi:hypothetical protein
VRKNKVLKILSIATLSTAIIGGVPALAIVTTSCGDDSDTPAPTSIALSYSQNSYTFTRTVPISNLTPTTTDNNGKKVSSVSYSVSPVLPNGLTLNTTTGVISGTPTVAQTATVYTITATGAGT